MDVTNTAWKPARQAWRRLIRYLPNIDGNAPGDPLAGLADIGIIRRQLDQAELASVRAAREHGRSWAEIATNLGITRQSAWERWRELDESIEADARTAAARRELGSSLSAATRSESIDATGREPSRRVRRKRAVASTGDAQSGTTVTVVVPDVVALSSADARETLVRAGLVAIAHNPGGAPIPVTPSTEGVVADQVPIAGVRRRAGSLVTIWIEHGGGSAGVREPRRPVPSPRSARVSD
jgi:hypothetical protein